jgi:hypothetical protein
MKPNPTEIIGYFAIAIILISLFFIGTKITGLAVTSNETGIVNVTITGAGALNFTTALLDFGAGAVTGGSGATLDSEGTVTNGDWSATTGELVLENIGNVNVTLTLSTNKSVDDFIGGSSPTFKAKVTNTSGHTTSCVGANFSGSYETIDQTLKNACTPLTFLNNDTIDIDFELFIPNDAAGAKTVGIVAIGTY